ncbi:MAG: adenylyltransferase/cytidyltransferase family protein [Phycisphaerae bacterium]|nr:adenylyltransferase/cytidyltransferase family protein [Phycisphaerae bacterium]
MAGSSRKIKDLDSLLAALRIDREAGKTVVQCHGCFDIVHPGHIRYLEFAKRQGDVLVVSLTADSAFTKNDGRPCIPDALRAENLAALECVDYVVIDPHPTAKEILSQIKPDAYVKGREYEQRADPRFLEEKQVVESYGGKTIYSSGEVVFSSTALKLAHGDSIDIADQKLELYCKRYQINRRTAEQALRQALGLKVLVVGDLVVDRYVFCDASDVASEAPVISLAQLDQQEYLGGSAIIAQHIKSLGGEPFLISSIGRDLASYMVLEELDRQEIEHFMIHNRSRPVSKTRYLVEEQKIVKVDDHLVQPTDTQLEKRILDQVAQRADEFQAVIFCDFGYGLLTAGLIEKLTAMLRDRVGWISADVSGTRGKLMAFRNVDLLTPTEREIRAAMHDFEQGLSPLAHMLLTRTDSRNLFVTLGRKGLVIFDGANRTRDGRPNPDARLRSEHIPTLAASILDRLGCGDALLATSTMVLAAGGTLEMAGYLGSLAAAIELGRLGNVPVSYEMMMHALDAQAELRYLRQPPARAAGA